MKLVIPKWLWLLTPAEDEEDRADAESFNAAKRESTGDFRPWREVAAEIDAEEHAKPLRRPVGKAS